MLEGQGYNPDTEQVMERQNWSPPDIMKTLLVVCSLCAVLYLHCLTHSSVLWGRERVQNTFAFWLKSQWDQIQDLTPTLPETAQVESAGSSLTAQSDPRPELLVV